jgi:glycosyltransferase involved in cell wall biosynthesis
VNVLFLSTWFPYPPDNGSKIRVYYLLQALAQVHAVTLVSFAFDTAQPEQPGDLRSLCAGLRVAPVNPFTVNRAGALRTFLSPSPVVSRPIPTMNTLVADVLRTNTIDAIIASTEITAQYALHSQRTPASTVKILEEHNSLTRWMRERYAEQTNLAQRMRCWVSWQKTRRYEARLFRQFDLVTMVSEQDRAVCLTDLPGHRGQVEVVSNGVDCTHNRPGLAEPQPDALVFNGSLTYSANYDAMRWLLAEIYPRIRAQVPGISLTITGSISGVDLAGLALDDSVHLTRFVDDVRIPVAEAAVCVIPIRQGGGTRLKILEAMAAGSPVVSTSIGAEGLEVADGEDIILADSPEHFADGIIRLLRDPERSERLRTNGRGLVAQRYDWRAIAPRLDAAYANLIERRKQRSAV